MSSVAPKDYCLRPPRQAAPGEEPGAQAIYNKIAEVCKRGFLEARKREAATPNPELKTDGAYRDDILQLCDIYKSKNSDNYGIQQLIKWQVEKSMITDKEAAEKYENHKKYIYDETGTVKIKRRRGFITCDGHSHYESFGTDPDYIVKGLCPVYLKRIEEKREKEKEKEIENDGIK
jgi:hypothetical protein